MGVLALGEGVPLNNGVKIPWLGFGVWRIPGGEDTVSAVRTALQTGYRSIDTASMYGNEEGVGQALRESGIPRAEVFITTKVWNSQQGYAETLLAFAESLERLGVEYVDLYLIHWPVQGRYHDTWRALEEVYRQGRARAIGVSNFQPHHLEDLMARASVVPAVNQVELHPLLTQRPVRAFCAQHGIQVEAWRPVMGGRLDIPVLGEISARHGRSPAQVALRWAFQHRIVSIPKSVHPERIRENADIFAFELTPADMEAIDGLNVDRRFGADPDNFNF